MTGTFKGWHMAAITGSFFAVVIGVNVTLAVFAQSSWTGLVVKNSYVASQSFNQDAKIAREQQAVRWRFKLDVSTGIASVSIHDRTGQPLRGLNVRAIMQRPVNEAHDQRFKMQEMESGAYSMGSPLDAGAWIADITAEGSDHKPVRFVQRIFVK